MQNIKQVKRIKSDNEYVAGLCGDDRSEQICECPKERGKPRHSLRKE